MTDLHVDVVIGVGLAAAAWIAAWRMRRVRPRTGEAVAFAGALATLLAVLNGPLHALSDRYLFSAHMVQHLALTLVVPPLFLTGIPGWMIDRWLARSAMLRLPTRPLPALALYTIALVGWHLPGPYALALEVHAWHVVQHISLMVTATLAWWPVLGRSDVAPRLPHAAQILYLFVFGLPMTVVAAMITGAETLLYPFYATAPRVFGLMPLADQRLGGVIMWVPAGMVPLVAFTIVFFRWAVSERDPDEGEAVLTSAR